MKWDLPWNGETLRIPGRLTRAHTGYPSGCGSLLPFPVNAHVDCQKICQKFGARTGTETSVTCRDYWQSL
jgi:hypothetical protein